MAGVDRSSSNEHQHGADIRIPDHQLVSRIGKGSYGEVWLGRNMMGTYRAVKIVHAAAFENNRPFTRELEGLERFEPISRSHEGFVDVLQIGQNTGDGYFYYVMELGDGQDASQSFEAAAYQPKTLASELVARQRFPVSQCVDIGLALCDALACLHEKGLVHRDLKPSNIIFVNGRPKLADIGLVTVVGEAPSYVGTEGFIPPEGPGKPTADLFGLGKILYEMATGMDRNDFPKLPPHAGDFSDSAELMELNEVILRAAHHDATRRYQSARDLQADLVVLKNGQSVKRLRFLESRFAKLKKIALAAAALALLSGAVYFQFDYHRRQRNQLVQQQVGGLVVQGTTEMDSGNLLGALPPLVAAQGLEASRRGAQTTHRMRLNSIFAQTPRLLRMWFSPHRVDDVRFSASGDKILIAQYLGQMQIMDAHTGDVLLPYFGEAVQLRSAAFNDDATLVVCAGQDRTARVLNAADGRELFVVSHPSTVIDAEFRPRSEQFATACVDGKIRFWRRPNQMPAFILEGHRNAVTTLSFTEDGRYLISGGRDNVALVWDCETRQTILPPLMHGNWVYDVVWSPDAREVATASFDRKVRVWDAATGKMKFFMSHEDGVKSVDYSADGLFILCGVLDGQARLWSAENGQPAAGFPMLRHTSRVLKAVFGPHGHRIATVCADGTVRLWDLAGGQLPPRTIDGQFSPDGRYYRQIDAQGIRVNDSAVSDPAAPALLSVPGAREAFISENNQWILTVHDAPTNGLAGGISLMRHRLKAGGAINEASILPASFPLTNVLVGNSGAYAAAIVERQVHLVTFNGEGAQVTSSRYDTPVTKVVANAKDNRLAVVHGNQATVLNPAGGLPIFTTPAHQGLLSHAAFSPDDNLLATCVWDMRFQPHSAFLWNARTGESAGQELPHGDGVLYGAFSPDSRRLVTTTENFVAIVWDASTGKALTPPMKHGHQVHFAAFSSDGRYLATVCGDRTARVWNAETGKPLSPPFLHMRSITKAAFLDGTRRLLTWEPLWNQGWVWNISNRPWSVEDWQRISELYLGYRIEEYGVESFVTSSQLEDLYARLRRDFPEAFDVDPEQVFYWHRAMAHRCEKAERWAGAAFHYRCLLQNDQHSTENRERLEEVLAKIP